MECQEEDEYVTSVSWGADGKHIAVGTSSATVQIWDANRVKQIRNLDGHAARVGALSWNNAILSSGGRDSIIVNHDVRYCSNTTRPMLVTRASSSKICSDYFSWLKSRWHDAALLSRVHVLACCISIECVKLAATPIENARKLQAARAHHGCLAWP